MTSAKGKFSVFLLLLLGLAVWDIYTARVRTVFIGTDASAAVA